MTSNRVAVLVAACISLAALFVLPAAGAPQAADEPGRQLFQHDVAKYAVERGPRDGAPAADAIGFRVNNKVQGGALIVGLDRPVLGVFVGLNAPDEFADAPYRDLRVVFTLADGSTRSVAPAGGGGLAMLFQSPDDVPMSSLRMVALHVATAAEWAK